MKKIITVISSLIVLSMLLAGCGASSSQPENKAAQTSKKTINDILAESRANQTTAPIVDDTEYPELDYDAEVDLTKLNSNMVYSEVAAMVNTPEKYMGKTVKMNGTFDVYTDINTGTYYYSCIIKDATACCSSGIEFAWKGEHKFPDDYPPVGTPLTVGGIFETYPEGDKYYCRLKEAEVVFGT